MIRDSVVHEVDNARFLSGEELISVQEGARRYGDPMLVMFETESGCLVADGCFVRTGAGYAVRTEAVEESGSVMIGLDQNLLTKTTDGRWGGSITRGFVERFGQAYHTELQRWVDAARNCTVDGPGVWDGYAAVAVCEAGVQARRTGEEVAVDLAPRPEAIPAGGSTAPEMEAYQ